MLGQYFFFLQLYCLEISWVMLGSHWPMEINHFLVCDWAHKFFNLLPVRVVLYMVSDCSCSAHFPRWAELKFLIICFSQTFYK